VTIIMLNLPPSNTPLPPPTGLSSQSWLFQDGLPLFVIPIIGFILFGVFFAFWRWADYSAWVTRKAARLHILPMWHNIRDASPDIIPGDMIRSVSNLVADNGWQPPETARPLPIHPSPNGNLFPPPANGSPHTYIPIAPLQIGSVIDSAHTGPVFTESPASMSEELPKLTEQPFDDSVLGDESSATVTAGAEPRATDIISLARETPAEEHSRETCDITVPRPKVNVASLPRAATTKDLVFVPGKPGPRWMSLANAVLQRKLHQQLKVSDDDVSFETHLAEGHTTAREMRGARRRDSSLQT